MRRSLPADPPERDEVTSAARAHDQRGHVVGTGHVSGVGEPVLLVSFEVSGVASFETDHLLPHREPKHTLLDHDVLVRPPGIRGKTTRVTPRGKNHPHKFEI